jgi:hypothetical protein
MLDTTSLRAFNVGFSNNQDSLSGSYSGYMRGFSSSNNTFSMQESMLVLQLISKILDLLGARTHSTSNANSTTDQATVTISVSGNTTIKNDNSTDECKVTPNTQLTPVAIKDGATIWGDPHFVGADGENYDIKGEAGKTYNILSDKNFQLNSTFRAKGSNQTLMGAIGATIRNNSEVHQVKVTEQGELTIDNKVMQDGTYQVGNSTVTKKGMDVTIKTPEYEVKTGSRSGELALDFKSTNVASDGVMPHGLWGQTADGDGKKRVGDQGDPAQGGGVIEKLDGTISARGDTETYKLYEVKSLFDTGFAHFNRFGA